MALLPDFSDLHHENECHIYRATVRWTENQESLRQEHMIVAKDSQTAKTIAHNRAPYRLVKGETPNSKDRIEITIRDYGIPLPNRTYYSSPLLSNEISEILPGTVHRRRIIENPEAYYKELWEQQQKSQQEPQMAHTAPTTEPDTGSTDETENQTTKPVQTSVPGILSMEMDTPSNKPAQESPQTDPEAPSSPESQADEEDTQNVSNLSWHTFTDEDIDMCHDFLINMTICALDIFQNIANTESEEMQAKYQELYESNRWKTEIANSPKGYLYIKQHVPEENIPPVKDYCQSILLSTIQKLEEEKNNHENP